MVQAVIEAMRSRIELGIYGAGRSLPSERALAQDLQVSRLVVRQAIEELGNLGLIVCKPNCRPVVKGVWTKTNRTRAHGPRHVFIWLWPNTAYYSASCILKGIQSIPVPSDVRLVVGGASGDTDFEGSQDTERKFLYDVAQDDHAAGVIMWYIGCDRNLAALEAVKAAGIPIVFVDRMPPKPLEGDYVGTDNVSAAQAGVRHLIELGHTRIAFITNQDLASTVKDRMTGYRRALAEARVPYDPELVCTEFVDEPEGVEPALDALLNLSSPPTAIVGVNDHIALQVYAALERRGLSIPQDISVLGFDGLLRWVTGGGYLTSCCQQFERIGQLALELLMERVSSSSPGASRHILLEAPLADCGSTDRPRPTSDHASFVYSEKQPL